MYSYINPYTYINIYGELYDCSKLQREREKLIREVSKQDNWPVEKSDLVNKHIKHFIQFAKQ